MIRAIVGVAILFHTQSAIAQSTISSDDIKAVQEQLADDGYDIGDVDGQFGTKTADAIRQYQSDWKLPSTGEISPELINRLRDKDPATQPQWFKIENDDCIVWNEDPQAQETASWSGGCTAGKASGTGILRWRYIVAGETREDRYDGAIDDGKEHGPGVFSYGNGNRYDGEWREGKRHGRGVLIFANGDRYEGEFRNGRYNGRGVLTTAKGNRYEGEWRDGKRNGQGILDYADGGRYDGEWREGKRDGRGVLSGAQGSYDGEWRDDKAEGRGVATRTGGERYEGEWRAGKRHGRGILSFLGGNRFEGEWREGSINGHGVLIYPGGGRFEGEYRKGERNGHGVRIYADGDRFEGEFVDDLPNGRGTYTRDGTSYSGIWKNGCLRTKEMNLSVETEWETCGF